MLINKWLYTEKKILENIFVRHKVYLEITLYSAK